MLEPELQVCLGTNFQNRSIKKFVPSSWAALQAAASSPLPVINDLRWPDAASVESEGIASSSERELREGDQPQQTGSAGPGYNWTKKAAAAFQGSYPAEPCMADKAERLSSTLRDSQATETDEDRNSFPDRDSSLQWEPSGFYR